MAIHTQLSLVAGKYTRLPNVVLVPKRKAFPVSLELDCECPETHVVGAADKAQAHEWCILDEKLRQVMVGGGNGKRSPSKRVFPYVSRTLMGGGALNPKELTVELASAKLEKGATYTLIFRSYGVTAACDFVAVHEPEKKPAKKGVKGRAGAKRGVAKKRRARKRS